MSTKILLVSLLICVLLKHAVAMPGPMMPDPKADTKGYPYPESRGNEGVRLYFGPVDDVIPNYSIIKFDDFSDSENTGDGNTVLEGIWCQSSDDSVIGRWYTPNHDPVPVYTGGFGEDDDHMHGPGHKHMHASTSEVVTNPENNFYNGSEAIFSAQFDGQSVLLRDRDSTNTLSENDEGLYYCDIANQTLVIGLFTATTFNNSTGSRTTDMQIDFVESKKVMITFNVTSGPPTYVSCVGPEDFRVNETSDEVNRVMIDENTTGISVILKERYEGLIQCNVSNKRVQQGTINDVVATVATTSLVITTEESPSDVLIDRLGIGLEFYKITWLGSSYAYGVFYSIVELNITQSIGYTMNDSYNVNISNFGIPNNIANNIANIEVFIVGIGMPDDASTLPSPASNASSICLDNYPSIIDWLFSSEATVINMSWNLSDVEPSHGYVINASCTRICEPDDQFTPLVYYTNQSSYELHSLFPGSICHISIQGIYGNELFNFMNSTIQRTQSSVPVLPPQNVSVVSVTSQSIEIIWDEVSCQGQNGPITGYNVAYRPATESSTSKDSFTTLNTSTVLRDLLPYTNYFITITPINEAGKGNSSFLMQQTNESEPGQVSSVVVTDGNNSIIVSWIEPSIVTGVITMYDIRYKLANETDDYKYINGITRNTYEITQLSQFTKYLIEVRAHTSVGPGEWIEIQALLLPEIQRVTLTNVDDMSLVSWSPSNDDHLSKIVVRISKYPGDDMYEIYLSTNISSFRLSFIQYSIAYNITVFGIYLVDNELFEGKQVLLHYYNISPNTTSSCSSSQTVLSAGGLQPKDDNTLTNALIAVVVTMGIALLIAVIVIIVLGIVLWRKREEEKVKQSIASLESARKMSVKDEMYVQMSKSKSPAYQNLPSTSTAQCEDSMEKIPEASGVYEAVL